MRCGAGAARRVLAGGGGVALTVCEARELVREAAGRHGAAPTAAAALGRALVGGVLLTAFKGEGEGVSLRFRGTGPLGGVTVVADSRGYTKGMCGDPSADPPLRPDGKLDVGGALGAGVLSVVRSNNSLNDTSAPYEGQVALVSGEIAEDLAHYLAESEQVNSAMGLGVLLGREGEVREAGGFLLEILPHCSDATLTRLEESLSQLPSISSMLDEGLGAEGLADRIMAGFPFSTIGEMEPQYGPCTVEGPDGLRERMLRAVTLLGKEDAYQVIKEQGRLEVRCDFCAEALHFGREDVSAALDSFEA